MAAAGDLEAADPEVEFVLAGRAGEPARAIQSSAVRSAGGSMWQVRTRPVFSDRTRPQASSTCRCCMTAGSDMASGSASWLLAETQVFFGGQVAPG
jgi:hypothetical protein